MCFSDTLSLGLPAHQNIYSGGTRGYWFIAPTDFIITGLRVPFEAGTGNQYIEVLRFNTAPPVYANVTNDFTSLGYFTNIADTFFINTNIQITAGDTIGIFGVRGADNSYGATNHATNIAGFPVTLQRLGFQADLQNGQAFDVFTETTGSISRVEMLYVAETGESNQVAVTAVVEASPVNTVTLSSATLTADAVGATYQWVDCNNGDSALIGETAQSFNPSIAGDYAVIVTSGACSVQSDCVNFTVSSLNNVFNDATVRVYPNPSKSTFVLELGEISNEFSVSVYNLQGQRMMNNIYYSQ